MEGQIAVGHPVDVASGVFFTAANDIVIPGVMPLIWRRAYSTGLLTYRNSALGPGWVHRYDTWLERTPHGYLLFTHDGRRIPFADARHTVEQGAVALNAAASMDLRLEGSRYAVYHWHGWDGELQKLLFVSLPSGRMMLDAIEDPLGHGLCLRWNGQRLLEVTQSVEGKSLHLGYDSAGRIETITARAQGAEPVLHTRYEYSPSGLLVVATDALGASQVYAYDDRGSMIQEMGPAGATFLMRYDGKGRCYEVSGHNRYQYRRLDFDSAHAVTRVTDSLGAVTVYRFNARGQVETIRHPDGGLIQRTFDAEHRIATQTDALGRLTTHEFDSRGDRIVTTVAGRRTEWTFDTHHLVTSMILPGDARWTFEREPATGRLDAIIDPSGAATRFHYDDRGLLIEQINPLGESMHIEHAADWRSQTIRDSVGLILTRRFDAWQRTIATEDARGIIAEFAHDAIGRIIERRESSGAAVWRFTWDPIGKPLESVNPAGGVLRNEYSSHGELLRTTTPGGAVYQYAYDSEGHCREVINPLKETASFEWDSMGRIVAETRFGGTRRITWRYDLGGRLIAQTKPGGTTLEFEYDDANYLTRTTANGETLETREYDERKLLRRATNESADIQIDWDAAGRLVAEGEVRYRRDALGGLRGVGLTEGSELQFDLDVRGRLARFSLDGAVQQLFQYDAADLLMERNLAGQAIERFEYDDRRRIAGQQLTAADGQTVLLRRGYSYDRGGNLTQIAGPDLQRPLRLHYDPERRMIAAGQGEEIREFDYDDCWNLKQRPDATFSHAPGGEVAIAGNVRIAYNADGLPASMQSGNRRFEFLWDALDRLVEIRDAAKRIARYVYDPFGRRIRKQLGDDGPVTDFVWAGDHLLAERNGEQSTLYWNPDFEPMWSATASAGSRHIVTNPTGTPAAVLTRDGALTTVSSGDFGESSTELTPFRLRGQYADPETGFHYNLRRYWWPLAARFLSPDPIGYRGGANLFVFAPNVTGFFDPLGLTCGTPRCGDYAVYALMDVNDQIQYIGITMQDPQKRCNQHQKTKVFDHMEVLEGKGANGALTKQEARSLEGSILHNVYTGQHGMGQAYVVDTSAPLQNAQRKATNPGYYHSYDPNHQLYQGPNQTGPVLQQAQQTYY